MSKSQTLFVKSKSLPKFSCQKQELGLKLAHKLLMKPQVEKPAHVDKVPSKEWSQSPNLWGKVLKRTTASNGVKDLKIESADEADIIAIGGLDFDNKHNLSALLKSLETLLPNNSDLNFIAVYPSVDREVRYDEAMKYNNNKVHYPKYVVNLVREHILPRFVEGQTLRTEIKPLTLYSFSVGGREISMIENCLREIFIEECKASVQEVKWLFSYINSLSLAYAIDSADLPELRFKKIVVISEDDTGVLKPTSFASKIMAATPPESEPNVKCYAIDSTDLSHETQIFYLKSGSLPIVIGEENNPKPSRNGHTLGHYIEAITNSYALHSVVVEALGGQPTCFDPIVVDLCADW